MNKVYEFVVSNVEEAQMILDNVALEDQPTDIEMTPDGLVAVRFVPNTSENAIINWLVNARIKLLNNDR